MPDPPPRLQRLSRRALLVAPVRLVAGAAGVMAAVAAGSPRAAALLAFAIAVVGLLVMAAGDPRRRFFELPDDLPEAPADAVEEDALRLVAAALLPSSAGLAAVTAVALAFEPTLAAITAGLLAGLGVAAALTGAELAYQERATGTHVFLVSGTQRVVGRSAHPS